MRRLGLMDVVCVAAIVLAFTGRAVAENVETTFELAIRADLPAGQAMSLNVGPKSPEEVKFDLRDVNGVGEAFWTKAAPKIGIRLSSSDQRVKATFTGAAEGKDSATLDQVKASPSIRVTFLGEPELLSETRIPVTLKVENLKPGSRVQLQLKRSLDVRVASKWPWWYALLLGLLLLLILAILFYALYRLRKRPEPAIQPAPAPSPAPADDGSDDEIVLDMDDDKS